MAVEAQGHILPKVGSPYEANHPHCFPSSGQGGGAIHWVGGTARWGWLGQLALCLSPWPVTRSRKHVCKSDSCRRVRCLITQRQSDCHSRDLLHISKLTRREDLGYSHYKEKGKLKKEKFKMIEMLITRLGCYAQTICVEI